MSMKLFAALAVAGVVTAAPAALKDKSVLYENGACEKQGSIVARDLAGDMSLAGKHSLFIANPERVAAYSATKDNACSGAFLGYLLNGCTDLDNEFFTRVECIKRHEPGNTTPITKRTEKGHDHGHHDHHGHHGHHDHYDDYCDHKHDWDDCDDGCCYHEHHHYHDHDHNHGHDHKHDDNRDRGDRFGDLFGPFGPLGPFGPFGGRGGGFGDPFGRTLDPGARQPPVIVPPVVVPASVNPNGPNPPNPNGGNWGRG